MLPLHLIRPSGCPLQFAASQRSERVKEMEQTPPQHLQTLFFYKAPCISITLSALPPPLAPSQSQSRLTGALAAQASSIDPIKPVVGGARLEELAAKPIV